jgi:glutathione S-transferase
MRSNWCRSGKASTRLPSICRTSIRAAKPALRTDNGVLTENVAILTYIARLYPHAKLLPEEPIGIARCISQMAYLSFSCADSSVAKLPGRTM